MHCVRRPIPLIVALSVALANPVFAQSRETRKGAVTSAAEAGEPAGYREAIAQAVAEYQLQNWDEARALFGRAHSLYPNARTARGLGIVEFERRNYGECIRYLEESLRSDVKALDPATRGEVERLLARAKGFVARVALDVAPPAAEVRVNGVPVELGPDRALILPIGEHVIEVQADDFKPERRRLNVRGGEDQTLTFVLTQEPAHQSGPRVAGGLGSDGPTKDSRRRIRNPWLWTAVSVVVVGGVVSGMLLLRPEPKTQEEPLTTSNTPRDATLRGLVAW